MSIEPGKQPGKKKPAKKKGAKVKLPAKEKKSDVLKKLGITYELVKIENPDHRATDKHKYTVNITHNSQMRKHAWESRPTIDDVITMWKSTQPK